MKIYFVFLLAIVYIGFIYELKTPKTNGTYKKWRNDSRIKNSFVNFYSFCRCGVVAVEF